MPTHQDLRQLAALATDAADRMAQGDTTSDPAAEVATAQRAASLADLLAEMQAMLQVLPVGRPQADRRPDSVQTDAEVEAGFDNMPI